MNSEALAATTWRKVVAPLPSWWTDNNNALYLADGADIAHHIIETLVTYPFSDVLIVLGSKFETLGSLLVGGNGSTVFVDQACTLFDGQLYCGADSELILHGPILATARPVVDARNGGSVIVQADQLWAANVYIATDDMHRLEDRTTGERLNPYGSHISIGEHVWLCRDAVVTGHVEIGDGSVVAMRSMVRAQKVPDHTVVAGVPAAVVRENVAWSFDDAP